jgi:hypothetical protein
VKDSSSPSVLCSPWREFSTLKLLNVIKLRPVIAEKLTKNLKVRLRAQTSPRDKGTQGGDTGYEFHILVGAGGVSW